MTRSNPRPRDAGPAPAGGTRLPFEVAPALSAVGLLVVAAVSFMLLGGSLPSIPGSGNNDGGPGGPIRTPTPSNVVVVDPRTKVPGSILYVKDGNIWVQSGEKARQLTSGGRDAMPAWSPDGASIYFVRTRSDTGRWPSSGEIHQYVLSIPSLMKMPADGSADPTALLTGRVKNGGNTWSYFIREPSISPDESRVAIVTDGPDPTRSDVLVKLVDLAKGAIRDPKLPENSNLGHQDPAWSPDGTSLLYVRNAREGARGTPVIYRYNLASGKSSALTGAGYMGPSWSRDGRYVAATKQSSFGTDIVILDARTGAELLRLTSDEKSFSPIWSPMDDSVAFFRVEHGVVDLYLLPLTGTAPEWTVGEPIALTVSAGLDGASHASWFIPASELPPLPTPTTAPAASPGPS